MKPVIVLVGRPNVGKSTLFNALTRSRDALVADSPGLTRDRQYGNGRLGERPHFVVDTGGLGDHADGLRQRMSAQARLAMQEGDAILFLTDGRAGLNADDREIAEELRRLGKPITLVVNKTEGMQAAIASADFYSLGLGEPVAISAAHGNGVSALMERVLAAFPPGPLTEPDDPVDAPRIAVAGRPNVGKSTLVNALLGEERVVVYDEPGTTRDSIRIPLERRGKHYVLIDTAGVRKRARVDDTLEKFSVIKTLQAIDEANVVVLALDASQEVSDQDVNLAAHVLEQGRSLVLAVNKWDNIESSQREWIKREVERKLPFLNFAPPHFISALQATGIGALFPAIDRAFASAYKSFPTSRLNRILERAVQSTPPPRVHGRRIKLKFAHQGGKNPPRVIIHGNQVESVPDSYARYLGNVFREAFKLEGTPIKIEFVQGENPYAGRRQVLNKRQLEKRRRIRRIQKKKFGAS